jgi:YggT family protein
MVQLKASDEYSSASKDVVASVDLNGALAFVTTLPSPHTFRTEGYVSRQSLSLLSGRPLSKLPELPVKKRKGRLGDKLNAFRLGLERQVHGIQHSAAETLQNVQNAAKELFVDLGLVEKEQIVRAEDEATEWYEDEVYQVKTMNVYNPLQSGHFAAILPGDGVAEMVATSSIYNFLNIYNTLLIGRLVLTWFPNPPEIIANPLSTICDPYLNLFRGIIPPIGGTIDLSPVLAFLALNVFTNAAQALPAEIPPNSDEPVYQAPSAEEEIVLKRPVQKRNMGEGIFKLLK